MQFKRYEQHAAAQHVEVTVRQEATGLMLSIRDDGKGFDARHERGMGLLGMEERVSHLGGSFAVDSALGQGTRLQVVLPLPVARPEPTREMV